MTRWSVEVLARAMYLPLRKVWDCDDAAVGDGVADVWRRVARAAHAGGGNPDDIRILHAILERSARERSYLSAYTPLAEQAFRQRKALAGKKSRVRQSEWDKIHTLMDELSPRYKKGSSEEIVGQLRLG